MKILKVKTLYDEFFIQIYLVLENKSRRLKSSPTSWFLADGERELLHLSGARLFRSVTLVFIILMFLSLPLSPYTAAEPCSILKVSLPEGAYVGSNADPWLDECWLLNLTCFSQTFTVRINNTSAEKRSYDTHLVIALNGAGYSNLQSLVVNGTSVPGTAFRLNKPQPYGLWDWPSGDVYPTWFEDTYVNVGTVYRGGYTNVVVAVTFSNATGIRMHFDAYGSTVSGALCYSGYITHNGISEDSTVLFNAGASANQPPIANFSYAPSRPTTYESVNFNASESYDPDGYITGYEWDFGDGNVTTAASPAITHIYADYGDFEVTLTVTDNEGESDMATKPITVENSPKADFWWTPTAPTVCENVTFDASTSTPDGGVLTSYAWNFGDGTPTVTESEPTIIHRYVENGTFTVTLNVTDSEGRWDTESKEITVNPCVYYLTVKTAPLGILTIPGEGWYDNGTHVNLDALAYVPDENGDNSQRYKFDFWDIDGSDVKGNPVDVLMTANHTATARYVTQYLITFAHTGLDSIASNTVVTVNGTPKTFADLPFLLWADNGSSVTYDYNAVVSSTIVDNRFRLDHIGSPQSPFTVTGPETVTGHYTAQYYLTITATAGGTTNPLNGNWWDAGSSTSVLALPDPDYALNHWELDSMPVGSANPYSVLMNSAHTLHAVFEHSPPPPAAYYLTVKTAPLGVTSIPGESWYDEGSDVVLAAPGLVDVSTGTRYKFDYWDVDSSPRGTGITSTTVHMDANHTATAHYTLQYYLTVTSVHDTPTPASGWFNAAADVTASVTSPWAGSAGTRYVCTGWTGTGSVPSSGSTTSVAFIINAPSTITWNWKTQYYLTVETNPPDIADIAGEGWYDPSTNVALTAPPDAGHYEFRYWDVDGVPQDNGTMSISVKMDAPHTVTANYRSAIVGGAAASINSTSPNVWVGLNSLLIAAVLAAASWVRKRRRNAD
jgi:PKD repeat protein